MFTDQKTGVTIYADLNDSVSRATLRPFDLVHAFLPVIRDTAEYAQILPLFPSYAMEDQDSEFWDDSECSYLLNECFIDVLDMYAPDGYYFGCTEGDGSDFGYWKINGDE